MQKVISRKEARERGLRLYYTGKPCKYDHIAERTTSGGNCTVCAEQWRKDNKEHLSECGKKYREENREAISEYLRNYYAENKEEYAKKRKAYYEKNKEYYSRQCKEYRENNSEKLRAYYKQQRRKIYEEGGEELAALRARKREDTRRRELFKRNAILHNTTEETQKVYEEALLLESKLEACVVSDDELDTKVHVDHIVPLINDLVCGLHTSANLQIISARENQRKANSFTPYWENHLTGEIHYV